MSLAKYTRLAAWAVVPFIALLALTSPAHAYLDPGSGNYLMQMLIGALVGAGYAVKVFWQRIVDLLARLVGRRKPGAE